MTPPPTSALEGAVDAPLIVKPTAPRVEAPRPAPAPVVTEVRAKPKPEWLRLLFHVLAISFSAYLCLAIEDPLLRAGPMIGALVLAVLYEILRIRFAKQTGWLLGLIKTREIEAKTRTASTDFVAAMGLCTVLFSHRNAATAFLVLAIADPLARLFGIYFGSIRWPRSRKTFEGSIGFFVATCGIVMCMGGGMSIVAGVFVAIVATAAELMPQRIYETRLGSVLGPSDNFWVPLATSMALAVVT